jgi:hypothetical protein
VRGLLRILAGDVGGLLDQLQEGGFTHLRRR